MLSRIPAVKWAFQRLRPQLPGGSIDAAPSAADEQPAIIAEAAPALHSLNIEPMPGDAGIEVAVPVEDNTAVSVIEETASAATTNIGVSDHTSPETPTEVELVVVEQTSGLSVEVASEPVDLLEVISSVPPAERLTEAESEVVNEAPVSLVEVDAIDASEPVVSSDLPVELLTDGEPDVVDEAPVIRSDASTARPEDVEPVAMEHVATAETELKPVESSGRLVEEEPACALSTAVEAVTVDEASVIVVDAGITVPASAEASVDSEPASSVAAAEIEPDAPDDLPPGPAIAAEDVSTDTPVGAAQVEPAPAPKSPSAPKVRAKIVEPADRATLIRQRWSETGIRMWNPRLHGTGEATLNIQGRIELLPPEPGETMPRYDKLEFKLLGGQIVCEGVIVEAPADASQRSFTRLAEPRGADRTREPVRERQAALA
ncbi:hypothetical protein [Bradyrhizobium guangdongense]